MKSDFENRSMARKANDEDDDDLSDFIYDDTDGGNEIDAAFDLTPPAPPCGLEEISQFLSDDTLKTLAGTDDLTSITHLELRLNTEEITMRDLGTRLPRMTELKANNSNVPSLRDLGTSFGNLQVLWLSRSGLSELDGISAFSSIRELYLSFNDVSDMSPLSACESLEILDLEGNNVDVVSNLYYLSPCALLRCLTLEGNPISLLPDYRETVINALPGLELLDDVDVKSSPRFEERVMEDIAKQAEEELKELEALSPVDLEGMLSRVGLKSEDLAVSPQKSPNKSVKEALAEERGLVLMGIKYCKVGCDDPEFLTPDEITQVLSRPKTSASRPLSASFVNGQTPLSIRPRSSHSRPDSGGSKNRMTMRPSTAGGRPSTAYGNKSASSYGRGIDGLDESVFTRTIGGFGEASSDLTFGTSEVFCGNPVMALRSRKIEGNSNNMNSFSNNNNNNNGSSGGSAKAAMQRKELTQEDFLEDLKRYKIETATIINQEEPPEVEPIQIGDVIGSGKADRFVLSDEPEVSDDDKESGDNAVDNRKEYKRISNNNGFKRVMSK